jgi:hypothetical protein
MPRGYREHNNSLASMDSAQIAKVLIILDEFFIHVDKPSERSTIEQVFTDIKNRDMALQIVYQLLYGQLYLRVGANSLSATYVKQGAQRTQDCFTRSMPVDDLEILRSVLREMIVVDAANKPTVTAHEPPSEFR